ncbi:MAG: HmuY family protein [Flavobacteriales bacterium]
MKKQVDAAGVTTISNLYARPGNEGERRLDTKLPTRHFSRFRFSDGALVNDTSPDWDIAFSGEYIIVNGGEKHADGEPERTGAAAAAILSHTRFAAVTDVKNVDWRQDRSTGPAITYDVLSRTKGWCYYDMGKHVVYPIPGRILVFRTRDGKYAKVEITSYYKDILDPEKIPAKSHDFGYYTFRYAYNRGTTFENGMAKHGDKGQSPTVCACPEPQPKITPKRPAISVPGNSIENGGFESGSTTWELPDAFEVTDTDAHSGAKSLHFYKPIGVSAHTKSFKLTPGNYRLSLFAKGVKNQSQIQASIAYTQAPPQRGSGGMRVNPAHADGDYGWYKFTRDFKVVHDDENAPRVSQKDSYTYRVSLGTRISDDTQPVSVYFDDVSLVRVAKVHFSSHVKVVAESVGSFELKLNLEYPAARDTEVKVYLFAGDFREVHFVGGRKFKEVVFAKGAAEATLAISVKDDKVYRGNREYEFIFSSRPDPSSHLVVDDEECFMLLVEDDEKPQ